MKNIGISIGVSSYKNAAKLTACEHDARAIFNILNDSQRFDEILLIDKDTDSASVKSKLTDFIKRQQGEDIGDVVFYFSGHGDFDGNDFAYILSDYDDRKRNITSLSNEELDSLVRSIKPTLFSKIVDACQSGSTYIKENDSFPAYLKSAEKKFSNVYFLFSSRNDEKSYATADISDFTKAIIETVISRPDGIVRYKDVIDGVVDSFSGRSGNQNPFYVIQASLTEEFFDLDDAIRSKLRSFVAPALPTGPAPVPPPKRNLPTLADVIADAAKEYVTKEAAQKCLTSLPSMFDRDFLSKEVKDIYSRTVSESGEKVPAADGIGQWLESYSDDPRYFASPDYSSRSITRRVPKSRGVIGSLRNSLANFYPYDEEDYKEVQAIERYVSGFSATCDTPYKYISVIVTPRFDNLSIKQMFVVPLISRSRMRTFYAFATYRQTDFDKTTRGPLSKWSSESAMMNNKVEIKNVVDGALLAFSHYIEEPLLKKFGPLVETAPTGNS